MDADTGTIVASTLTGNDVGDPSQVAPLLDRIDAAIASVTADGAYDGMPTYEVVAAHNEDIRATIHRTEALQFSFSGMVSYSVQANFFESGDQPPVLPEPCPPKKVLTVVNLAPFAPTPFCRRSILIFMPSPMYEWSG